MTFRYGDGTKYGEDVYGVKTISDRPLTWGIIVDWDEDGSFTGENEATGRLLSLDSRMGREFVLNANGDGFQHPDVGELSIVLLNEDGRYDPYYPSSPLADYLYRNQQIKVVLKDESTGTRYYEFTGYINDIRPNYGAVKTATIYADGAAVKLKSNIKSGTIYTGNTYDEQIGLALDTAGWTGERDIDTAVSEILPYHWFSGIQALTEIYKLTDAAFGTFWVNEEGTARYRSRINADVSTQTITDDDTDYYYGIQAPAPRDVLKNKIQVYARARQQQTDVEIWRLVDKPQITGTGSPIWATFNYNGEEVPALSVTNPVATTDYTANDNADGSGTNRTANFSFALEKFATAAKITPSNSGSPAYLTLLKLRGNVITADKYTYKEVEDTASIALYGERELIIQTDWLQDGNAAQEHAEILVQKFSTPKVFPRFKFRRDAIGAQYLTPLFDLITVNFSQNNITGEYRIGYRERHWSINEPTVIDTIVYCEPNLTVAASSNWVFPMSFPTIFT